MGKVTASVISEPPVSLLTLIGQQLGTGPEIWPRYAKRPETRREHLAELQAWLNLSSLSGADYRRFIDSIVDLAQQTDRGIVLAEALVKLLRQQRIILPPLDVIERMCSEALTRGTRHVHEALTALLTNQHRRAFEQLLAIRLGSLVNAHSRQPFATYWGDGTTSSSDGQNFKASGRVNVKYIRTHWDEILRLAASIKQGTVTASLMLRKLGSYPRQNGLAIALRERTQSRRQRHYPLEYGLYGAGCSSAAKTGGMWTIRFCCVFHPWGGSTSI